PDRDCQRGDVERDRSVHDRDQLIPLGAVGDHRPERVEGVLVDQEQGHRRHEEGDEQRDHRRDDAEDAPPPLHGRSSPGAATSVSPASAASPEPESPEAAGPASPDGASPVRSSSSMDDVPTSRGEVSASATSASALRAPVMYDPSSSGVTAFG